MVLTYLEHCATEDALAGGCIRERWQFAPGLGVVSIEVLSASTTWDGLCTRAELGVKQCHSFAEINARRVEDSYAPVAGYSSCP
jgi:hypothetical protein